MKQIITTLFLCVLLTSVCSCNKDKKLKKSFISGSIVGTWELAAAQAGMIPTVTYPPGNGNLLKFTDESYQVLKNGQLAKSGNYTIAGDTTVEANVCLVVEKGSFKNRIIYDNDYNANKVFVEVKNDTLSIISGCFALDGGSLYKYIKKEIK